MGPGAPVALNMTGATLADAVAMSTHRQRRPLLDRDNSYHGSTLGHPSDKQFSTDPDHDLCSGQCRILQCSRNSLRWAVMPQYSAHLA
jgi:hypothetical protein